MIDEFVQQRWDARYRTTRRVWSGAPNPIMEDETAALPPGRALDVGCGEGADALWLAQHGWHVTGVDISAIALERAAARAKHEGTTARTTWIHADVSNWEPPASAFDFVNVQFLHLPSATRLEILRRIATAVAPGGSLLVVGHHPSDLETGVPRPQDRDVYVTAEELAGAFDTDNWRIFLSASRSRLQPVDSGEPKRVTDTVLHLQRRKV